MSFFFAKDNKKIQINIIWLLRDFIYVLNMSNFDLTPDVFNLAEVLPFHFSVKLEFKISDNYKVEEKQYVASESEHLKKPLAKENWILFREISLFIFAFTFK